MKKVIVISTSLRHGSNSDLLADKFVEGAKAAGSEVEKISLVKAVSLAKSWDVASSTMMLTKSWQKY